jgi:hypothetical protein
VLGSRPIYENQWIAIETADIVLPWATASSATQ